MDLIQIDNFIYNFSHYTPTNYSKIFFIIVIVIVVIIFIVYKIMKKNKEVNEVNEVKPKEPYTEINTDK